MRSVNPAIATPTHRLVSDLERLSGSTEQEAAAVLLTRVPRGVTDLCPHLPLCLDANSRAKQVCTGSDRGGSADVRSRLCSDFV